MFNHYGRVSDFDSRCRKCVTVAVRVVSDVSGVADCSLAVWSRCSRAAFLSVEDRSRAGSLISKDTFEFGLTNC